MPNPSGPPLALTMGEPGGVGPEITVKAHSALRGSESAFFVIADPSVFSADAIAVIRSPDEAASVFAKKLPVIDPGVAACAAPGRADARSAPAVVASIEQAVRLVAAGPASAVVTNPIQKSSLIAAGLRFPGHTEFLEALTASAPMPAGRPRGAVMMIAGPQLKTVPLTIHVSVRNAAASLTTAMIVEKALIVIDALIHDFGIERPRIAVSGLNPHAGEGGAIGVEDRDIILPAVEQLREKSGATITGPHAADSMFHPQARAAYDAALCMLHDQALIPAKTLAFHDAVNVTLGLPIIRTSPDHGVALDIAGKGLADAGSLIAAIRLAARMAARRRRGR
jgi:4-hydroxythreonine-4-phosphate dehydrogenase